MYINKIYKKFFNYSDKVRFESNLPIALAVRQLSDKTRENPMIALTLNVSESTLVGKVTKDRVNLYRVGPFIGNLFKAHFYGKFLEINGKVALEGIFTMSLLAKILVLIPVAISLLVEIIMILVALDQSQESNAVQFIFFIPIMPLLLLSSVSFTKWFFKNDIEWISHNIKSALAR